MILICEASDKQKIRLSRQHYFDSLSDYLYQHPQVTLRDLVKVFSEAGFSRYLEACIEAGLILREERRYRLALPVFTREEQEQIRLSEAVQSTLGAWGKEAETIAGIFEEKRIALTENFAPYFVENGTTLLRYSRVADEDLALCSASVGDLQEKDLAGYFSANRIVSEPEVYAPLRRLIGDVDEDYFMQQTGWIVSRVLRGKKPRDSIFLNALLMTEIVAESDGFFLKIPHLIKTDLLEPPINREIVTAKSHFEKICMYSELCKAYAGGLQQWLVKIK